MWTISDLDLFILSIWIVYFSAAPVIALSFCVAISTITQSELVLKIEYFIDRNKIIIVVELVDGWKVSVLLALDWLVRISESVREFLSLSGQHV